MWSSSPVGKIYVPLGVHFSSIRHWSSTFFSLPTGTQMWQGSLPEPWTWHQCPQYGRARRQKGLAITGSGCALSHPIKTSGYPETDVLWRNHVVRPHWYAERSWRDAGWPGPCCLRVSSSGTRCVREQPLRWPQPCHVWLQHGETLNHTHLEEPLLNSRLTETLRD